jgi:hypothetical protein
MKLCTACSKEADVVLQGWIRPVKMEFPVHRIEVPLCFDHLADPGPAVGWTFLGGWTETER